MTKIIFEITENEVKKVAGHQLSRDKVRKVLAAVENDGVLWSDIEKSIRDAVRQITS